MGEEDKKPEKGKAAAEEKVKEDAPKVEKQGGDEKKSDEPKAAPPPPPPPQEIVLKVYMHCEGCARKVRTCLKGFEGVEDVVTDCRSGKVVVKGEKADPLKVLDRVQRKSHRSVELISPIPPRPPLEEPKKPEEKPEVKTEEEAKKEELPAITVVLGVHMHCEACAQEIRKRIQRMKGVESAVPDLKSSKVTVKGVFEPEKLTDYIHKRTGKHAVIVKVEPEKKDGAVDGEKKLDTKEQAPKPAPEAEKEPKKSEDSSSSSTEKNEEADSGGEAAATAEDSKLELKKNEFAMYQYHQYPPNYQYAQISNYNHYVQYPQRPIQEPYAYPPQMFSDENPNACHVM